MSTKQYTTQEKAAALAALKASGNMSQVSRMLGIPRKTLDQWKKLAVTDLELQGALVGKIDELADNLEKIAHLIVQVIPEKIAEAKLSDLTRSLSTAVQTRNLLKGMPTSISENRSVKQRYETAIEQMINESAKKGIMIKRDEAISLLEPHFPEIKKHLIH